MFDAEKDTVNTQSGGAPRCEGVGVQVVTCPRSGRATHKTALGRCPRERGQRREGSQTRPFKSDPLSRRAEGVGGPRSARSTALRCTGRGADGREAAGLALYTMPNCINCLGVSLV